MTTKTLRVLHYSTHDEECGVGKYQEQYVAAMKKVDPEVKHVFFELSPNKIRLMNKGELSQALHTFRSRLKEFDVLHIQHEPGLYSARELRLICDVAKQLNKRIIATVHAAPLAYAQPIASLKAAVFTLKPRRALGILKHKYSQNKWLDAHFLPLLKADTVLVHNQNTRTQLLDLGFENEKVVILEHPVQEVKYTGPSTLLEEKLQKKRNDILFCTTGWLHKSKGLDQAVKALSFLPENYKLAILGGIHGPAGNDSYLNKLCDLIDARGLKERVYITGFVKDDVELNNMIQACDVCVYPYDKKYYSQVSSGALNLAIANLKQVVAYPVQTFVEMRDMGAPIHITQSATYYELAKTIQIAAGQSKETTQQLAYQKAHSFSALAPKVLEFYRK